MNPSLTVKVRFHARIIHLDRPSAGDPGKAWQAGRSWRGGSRITGGQTPAAHHEACAASCAESDLMGSAGAGSLCAFRFTQTPEQDGCDTEAFHLAVLPPRPGEAQVSPALQPEKAPAPWTQRSSRELIDTVVEMKRRNPLWLPKDCRVNIERVRYRDQ